MAYLAGMITGTDIRPFRIDVPQSELDDLHDRLARTRWPDEQPDSGWSKGIPLGYLKNLAGYWRTSYDWRAQEAALNELPQFVTEIDGQAIHFIHVRSPEPNAVPLLISHGYPGSVVEYTPLISRLTDPATHGGDPADAFHVVLPSLPGFGFSRPLSDVGWEVIRTTGAFAELMTRLGYERFAAHGGDIGAGITGRLGATQPDRVIGTHVLSDRGALGMTGEFLPMPDDLNESERATIEKAQAAWVEERGYLDLQSQRPLTIGYSLTDSPSGQLAWIAEKFQTWTNPTAATPDEAVDRDQLLTNISLYWFTRTGATAARFLYEAAHGSGDWLAPSAVPSGVAVFNTDPLVRRIMDPGHKIAHWSEFAEGGHFAAMEAGPLLVEDLRAFFRPLRS